MCNFTGIALDRFMALLCFILMTIALPCAGQKVTELPIIVNQRWTHTNIMVNAGEEIIVNAKGTLHWFANLHYEYTSTPDGQSCPFQGFIAQGLACWSL